MMPVVVNNGRLLFFVVFLCYHYSDFLLSAAQDEILTVIRRIDSNWAEGKLGDKIGIFPISFVEVSTCDLAYTTDRQTDRPTDQHDFTQTYFGVC